MSVPLVSCPTCQRQTRFAPENAWRPFCSERCKGMDLGAWASEHFRLPEREPNSNPDFEQS